MSHGDFYRYDVSANRFVAGDLPDQMTVKEHLNRLILMTERFFMREAEFSPSDLGVEEIDIDTCGSTIDDTEFYEYALSETLTDLFGPGYRLELCWQRKPMVICNDHILVSLLARKC
jgi:hypothetical protein